MLKSILLVGVGGFFGSIARYGVKLLTDKYLPFNFPYATLIVNLLGCFIIGLLFGYVDRNHADSTLWMTVGIGFCGAFTTFSTFAMENNFLVADKQSTTAIIYMLISVVAGILLCRMGVGIMR